ncbi:LLM class flavin-dependent oxidoreductase [Gorillibacterium massiliense]|uniref:LLM class flavin-dependent oxidoreductase n=1 Tax=Gorillibacterium massiliense TaxID=1280390 RepID=UPI0005925C4A|nr:LLM class flavin-dependent oxidoreductase [Gorillibacterium massiliense]
MIKLGVLDHTHIGEGRTAAETLEEAVQLAQETEKLGFSRYWVSEHHGSPSLASSSPEILIAHLAAHTSRIRVGSGGIMLSHYSAYKVAENFRLLEALYPNRIDLGLGRAPGGMPISTRALQAGKYSGVDVYPEQVADLTGYLHDALPPGHPFAALKAAPVIDTAPELWLLGSSDGSARIAAYQGLPFAYAQFFGVPGGERAMELYRSQFRPSFHYKEPKAMVAVMAICADTEEEANRLASSVGLFFLKLEQGMELSAYPSAETAMHYHYSEFERARLDMGKHRRAVGTPEQVKEQLTAISDLYQTDEIVIASPIHNSQARLHSYRLIAEAFDIST